MNFNLTDVQQSWKERGRTLGRELPPDAAAADVIMGAARVGLIDARADLLAAAVAVEALAHESASAAFTLALHSTVTLGVAGDDRFSALLRGEAVGAVALSSEELPIPGGGHLTGRATWVAPLTNRGLAFVAASAGDGLAACVVALDAAGVTVNRAVRKSEINFFTRKIALHHQQQIFRPGSDSGIEHALEHRTNRRPDLFPTLATGSPKPAGVLRNSKNRDVAIVIKHRVGRMAPPEHDWITRTDADRNGGF